MIDQGIHIKISDRSDDSFTLSGTLKFTFEFTDLHEIQVVHAFQQLNNSTWLGDSQVKGVFQILCIINTMR